MYVAPRGPGVRQRTRERNLRPVLRRLQEHRVFHQERAGTEDSSLRYKISAHVNFGSLKIHFTEFWYLLKLVIL